MLDLKHTLGDFEDSLRNTRKEVLTMASVAQQNLGSAVTGLLNRNEDLCNDAIAEDEEVNQLERAIDQRGMEILIRFNPVATDLRMVVAAMKISANLERISDQAENVARRARKVLKKDAVQEVNLIGPIYELAANLLKDAVKSFAEDDANLALTLFERDQVLDKLHRKAIKKYTTLMEEDIENLRTYLNLIFIVRCLERVGDHSVNIGEETVYINQGRSIRHIGPSALNDEDED
ncbi:MAG: phosphate signaling complex protein PhoU [Verrucomicrobiales bacterium]|nr:phosphate signaling complex protein PhoU [Verrucomicrobiales bacterium]